MIWAWSGSTMPEDPTDAGWFARPARRSIAAMLPRLPALLTSVALLGALPAAAQAATISAEGGTLVYRSSSATSMYVGDSYPEGRVRFNDSNGITSIPASCTQPQADTVDCDVPAGIRIEMSAGNDSFGFMDGYSLALPVEVYGNGGDDTLYGDADVANREVLDGGDGKDKIDGFGGDDEVRGGAGDDNLEGNGGADKVLGGDGNDTLAGDDQAAPAADLIDGGNGSDMLKDYVEYGTDVHPPANVSLDGAANDGRDGEGDDVRSIERMIAYVSGRFELSDGAEDWQVWSNMNSGSSVVLAKGGDDKVVGEDAAEDIDGGAGNDYLEGGKNHDVITGGPGRDTIYGDDTDTSCNSAYPETCVLYGNDEIRARDGEADQIDCGAGTDKVVADAADVVSANCETVERGGASGDGDKPGGEKPSTEQPGAGGGAFAFAGKAPKLGAALRKGFKLRIKGGKPGKAQIIAVQGTRVIASGRTVLLADGSGVVKLKFTKKAVRKLRRAKKVTFSVSGATLVGKLTLKR